MNVLLDENLRSAAMWQAIQAYRQALSAAVDVVRVGDSAAPPLGSSDDDIVAWAAEHGRVLVSRDLRTLERALSARILAGQDSAGIAMLRRRLPIPEMAEIIVLIALATEEAEWRNAVQWFP